MRRLGARIPESFGMTLPDDWRHDREIGVQPGTTLDTTRVDDVRIGAVRPLISPALLLDDMPAPDSAVTLVEKARVELAKVLGGSDDRLSSSWARARSTTTTRHSSTRAT